MTAITHITRNVATASQPDAGDFAQIAAMGFRSVVNTRPDEEEGVPIGSNEARNEALKAGLDYTYLPAPGHDLFDKDLLDSFETALRELPGPVLIHCKSGTRSSILWALVSARRESVDKILRTLAGVGLDIGFLEPELREQSAAHGREINVAQITGAPITVGKVMENGVNNAAPHAVIPHGCEQSPNTTSSGAATPA